MVVKAPWFRIPSSDLDSLSKLASLPDASVEELLAALANQQPPLSGHRLAEQIAKDVPSVTASDLTRLVDVIMTLLAVRARIDESTDELADMVVSNEQLPISPEERVRLKKLLVRLLNLPPIVLAWKAVDVLYEHERTYHTARTITELRPLYGESVSDPPSAAVIVHSLKLSYHASDGVTEDIFLGLDDADVEDLIEILRRTQEKARTLKQMMANTGLPVLDPTQDVS